MITYSDFKFITPFTSSELGRGYVYTQDELTQMRSGETSKFAFGGSENDAMELSIMTIDGEVITSTTITSSLNYTPYTKSYIDVKNQGISYNYQVFQSDFVVVGSTTQSLFVDVAQMFSDLNVSAGTYKFVLDPVRYLIGTPIDQSRSLIVREISPSRKEIAVSPSVLRTSTDPVDVKLNQEFLGFINNQFPVKQLITPLLSAIESPSIYNAYFQAYGEDSTGAELAKYWYAFLGDIDWSGVKSGKRNVDFHDRRSSDVAVIQFITDIYYGVRKGSLKSNGQISNRDIYGIFDQFKNTMYQNYESMTTIEELKSFYYSLLVYILDRELNQITNTKPSNMVEITKFFSDVLYKIIFLPAINNLASERENHFTGYLKNHAYFTRTGGQKPILNTAVSSRTDPSGQKMLIIKFTDPLDSTVGVGDRLVVVNKMVTETLVQNIYLFTQRVVNLRTLRGPNLLVKFENEGNGTETLSIDEIIEVTGSQYDEISSKLEARKNNPIELNIDYRKFENFIRFSSAQTRLDIYDQKKSQIEAFRALISDLEIKVQLHPTDDQYKKDLEYANQSLDAVEGSMDGYEKFLYNNPSWYNEHTNLYNGETSASLYDYDNVSSLSYSLPSYIKEGEDNSDYVNFVNMIGHYFDNLSGYIDQFTQKNIPSNSDHTGISKEIVYNMLSSLGWEPEIGRENLPLLLASFSKADFDIGSELWNIVGEMSEDERNKTVWKRILNSLPYILKTKGTAASINALMNCYGIPTNLISIKEYGGVELNPDVDQNSVYTFNETKYAIGFHGNSEYLQIPWTGSVQSVEFAFSFDPTKTIDDGKIFRVANCDGNWVIGFLREKGQEWGRAFFTIQDTGSNVVTTMTSRAPIFNGDTYSVMVRKNNIHGDFMLDESTPYSVSDLYPQKYELFLQRNEQSRTTYQVTASILLSGSFNAQWRNGSNIFFGNYDQNTASLGVDPESFFGTIDEVRLWEIPVDTNRYTNHSSYKGAHDADSPSDVVNKEIVRVSFGYPIDLYSASAIVPIDNFAHKNVIPSFYAVNFQPASGSVLIDDECGTKTYNQGYPYQFVPYNTEQNVQLPNFGSNKFRSNKINYKKQILVSGLSSDSRSTLESHEDSTVDTNKLGVFFSPTDQINSEIMKFFGNFEFGDLIGSPHDIYKSTYPRFEQFRKLYFDLGGGQLDYQTFMNMVRSYFDKSLFKYLKHIVPVRARTVTGILIEPSILERPKIQQKPIQQEVHRNFTSSVHMIDNRLVANSVKQLTQSLDITTSGTSVYDDYNRVFFNDRLDPHGFGIYAEDGIAYYKDDYWRADILTVTKNFIVERRDRLPLSEVSDYDQIYNNHGKYQTVSKNYEMVNISRFPVLTKYPIVPEFSASTSDPTNITTRTDFVTFVGSLSALNPILSDTILTASINGSLAGVVTNGYVLTGSATGVIKGPIGFNGTLPPGQSMQVTGSYNASTKVFTGRVLVNTGGSLVGFFYSPDKKTSIYEVMATSTHGEVFQTIINGSYSYRRAVSMLNIPTGSVPLNGYHFTHRRYKRKPFERKTVSILSNNQTFVGTFRRGQQTQKTTIQENGLADNSPPVTVIKQS